jgi:hypothetical protein
MKKWLVFFVSFTLFVAFIFLLYLYLYRAEFASTFLSRSFKVSASVEKMDIASDKVVFHNVSLDSPFGYSQNKAFFTKQVVVKMSLQAFLTCFLDVGAVKISEISIHSPRIHLETLYPSSDESNWSVMLKTAQERYTYFPGTRLFYVEHVRLDNVQTTFLPDVTQDKVQTLEERRMIQIQDPSLQNTPHTVLYILMQVAHKVLEETSEKSNIEVA